MAENEMAVMEPEAVEAEVVEGPATQNFREIPQFITELDQFDSGAHTLDVALKDIELDPLSLDIQLPEGTFKTDNYLVRQLLSKLKIPYNYFMECSVDLRKKELMEAKQAVSPKSVYILRFNGEDLALGVVPKSYNLVSSITMFRTLLSHLPNNVQLKDYNISNSKTIARFVVTDMDLLPTDTMYPGVEIQFSEVGACSFTASSYLYRLVCTNGMVCPTATAPSFKMPMTRFDEEAFGNTISQIPQFMFEALTPITSILDELRSIQVSAVQANGELPADFKTALDLILPSKVLQKDYKAPVIFHYAKDQNFTVNGVLNAVTRTARDLSMKEKYDLEFSVGRFISTLTRSREFTDKYNPDIPLTLAEVETIYRKIH